LRFDQCSLVPRSHKSKANYNPVKCYLPNLPNAFILLKKVAGFDSTADSRHRGVAVKANQAP
jgi:hypothetical protein